MTDKRNQTVRIQLDPSLHSRIMEELTSTLFESDEEFGYRYLRATMLSKYVGPDTDPAQTRKERAIEKWLQTEQRNGRTNIRLYGGEADFGFAHSEDLIEFARRIILKVIGKNPPADLCGSFSGGASTRHKRDTGTVARKFMGQADVTPEAWPYIIPMIIGCTAWHGHNPEVLYPRFVQGNVMFTVPKSTMIDRVACKEPDLNMFAQKACGDYIRRKLKRFGIDLNDQSVNRNLARQGSKDGSLATIDLSSASDSVTTGLVGRLLPPGWFVLLDNIRCKRTVIDGVVHENNMFSSMGNGFTFELESLIFYSLARAIAYHMGVRGRISVYGDDIIVPVKMAAALAQCFQFFGFTVNSGKSFWKGKFRESCGGHYYGGVDVTPFYVKEPIDSVVRLIHFLNRLRKWAGQQLGICDPRVFDIWLKYAKFVDRRFWGGDDLASKYQLVSRHTPRFKLVKVRKSADKLTSQLQLGLYLQVLNTSKSATPGNPEDVPTATSPFESPADRLEWLGRLGTRSSSLMREYDEYVMRRAESSALGCFPLWYTPDGKFL